MASFPFCVYLSILYIRGSTNVVKSIAAIQQIPYWPSRGRFEDTPDEFDNDETDKTQERSRMGTRVIMLGDGKEMLSGSDDEEMIEDEDKDEEELERKRTAETRDQVEDEKVSRATDTGDLSKPVTNEGTKAAA